MCHNFFYSSFDLFSSSSHPSAFSCNKAKVNQRWSTPHVHQQATFDAW